MIDYQIHTDRLVLLPLTAEWMEAMSAGTEKFQLFTGYHLPTPFTEFPEAIDSIILHLKTTQALPPWISYAIVNPLDSSYIGQAGFKGGPDQSGTVEIGYEIAEGFRLKGYADEVIRNLTRKAFEHKEIKIIMAHTLPVKNGSNHLLIKNKFVFQSAFMDPDDGMVWQWVLKRNAYLFAQMQ
ncbi:MAG: GNAT family N-acetyltransferase [Saprospiraceae bacterium]|nr:GNAT family N-acetyltransferase [Saprospiraceae bacterium]